MFEYLVQKGDTLWLIAKKYGLSLERLIRANPQIKDPNKISVGEKIHVPLDMEDGVAIYTVQKGDTMWLIAKKFKLALSDLIAANPDVADPDLIRPGDVICLPMGMADGVFAYTVREGDTIWTIAKHFEVTLATLLAANPQLEDADTIYPGQTVFVPRGQTAPPQTVANNGRLFFVKHGDTFFNIAQRFALNLDSLILVNPQIKECDRLTAGTQLYLNGYHHIKTGETPAMIASSYGVDLGELRRVNPQLQESSQPEQGQRIAIPRRENGDMAAYTVRPGDTLHRLAQNYNLPVAALLNANPELRETDQPPIGIKLRIPGPHLVQKGQTFSEIARLYDVSLRTLIEANPQIGNADRIYPQTMVKIPLTLELCRQEERVQLPDGVDYVIQKGDTLPGIASMFGVSTGCIREANEQLGQEDEVAPGQVVRIPIGCCRSVCYAVRRGDSLYKIARMYNISLHELIDANPQIADADHLAIGELVRVPLGEADVRVTLARCHDCPWYVD